MKTSFSIALALGLVLLACEDEGAAAPKAKAASKPAPQQTAAQDAQPEPKPAPKPDAEPAGETPAAAETKADPPAEDNSDKMYGPKNLTDAKNPKVNEKAPETFKANIETNEGSFVIEVTRAWAPNGADRFYNLVRNGFYDGVKFFRVIDGFMAQFGIHGDPKISAAWRSATIKDDPVKESNTRGMVTFAMGGPNTRTSQLFINFGDNAGLDSQGFPPFGKVVEGLETVDKIYKGYGEGAPRGKGPDQGRIQMEGNAYLDKSFPELDHIVKATIVE